MKRNFYTLDDLYQFCLNNNFSHFNAQEAGAPLVVHSPGYFSTEESSQGLIPVKLQACHTELNRNNSYISEEVMTSALPSFYNKPILGHVIEKDDGTFDFGGHDIELREDKEGKEYVHFLEQPIGVIPESAEARLEYDEKKEKTYVSVKGYIFEDYSNHASEIITNKKSVDVSVELYILDMSFSAKEKCLVINDFYFNGVTCLGDSVKPGMEGSNLSLENFELNNSQNQEKELMSELMDRLNEALSIFNAQKKEGGNENVTKLEELIEKYGITSDDIDFEIEGLSDEELEAKFEEVFGEQTFETTCPECGAQIKDEATTCPECGAQIKDDDDNGITDSNACKSNRKKKCSIEVNEKTYTYEVSLDQVIYTLENLVNATYGETDNTYYGVKVYETYVIMQDYWKGRFYKQNFSCKDDNYSLTGDRVEVYVNYLTKEEETELSEMRSNYSELKAYKENIEATELKEQKMEIINDEAYSAISESEEFKALTSNINNYSLEDVQIQADLILAKSIKEKTKQKQTMRMSYGMSKEESSFLDNLLKKSK